MYDFNINNFLSLIVCQIFLLQGQEMEQKYFFVDFLVNRNWHQVFCNKKIFAYLWETLAFLELKFFEIGINDFRFYVSWHNDVRKTFIYVLECEIHVFLFKSVKYQYFYLRDNFFPEIMGKCFISGSGRQTEKFCVFFLWKGIWDSIIFWCIIFIVNRNYDFT